ncbi:hypothetical protein OGAPHI_000372 [Ogataea philodendri]|uniref:Globin domain-containing protein n=1 Tax=Ogataea philodendri TaxID=1378263 RepID=A0A9P8PI33_9ASCO|nr:uncharacterized protein OGAPHI_000372 [Ogataea philodendri]KAH3671667.1 hypothetical protein OGAPHI_000372 [Ogataea philodendri]
MSVRRGGGLREPAKIRLGSADMSTMPSRNSDLSLSRSSTSTSIVTSVSRSTSVQEADWLNDSVVVNQPRMKIALTLSSEEIDLLRSSWSRVISSSSASPVATISHGTPTSSPQKSIRGHVSKPSRTISIGSMMPTSSFASSLFCIQLYENLIARDPQIEKLIPSIRHQASAFAGVINVAMSTLEDLSRMNESLGSLGKLHSRILGIEPEYFQIMGEVLLKTFRDRFANDLAHGFSIKTEEAWIKLYSFLANSIIQGGIDPIIQYSQPEIEKPVERPPETMRSPSRSESIESKSSTKTKESPDLMKPFIKTRKSSKHSYLNVPKRISHKASSSSSNNDPNSDCVIM